MRFLHLADLHLGKSLNGYSLLLDQEYILREILRLAGEHAAQAIVIAGDVYDRPIPSEEAVHLLDSFLRDARAAGLAVLLISGNHDSDERLHFGSALMEEQQVFIAGRYEGRVKRVELRDEHGPVWFDLLPFVKRSWVAHYHQNVELPDDAEAVRIALADCPPEPDERHVLVAHQFFAGIGAQVELAGSESMAANVGTLDAIPAALLRDYDYAALGHIHLAQSVGSPTCRYAGSPLKYHRSECRRSKSVPLVQMGPKGDVQVQLLPLQPMREMRELRGKLQDLLAPDMAAGAGEDYVYVTLTDEHPVPGAAELLRQRYPWLLGVQWDNTHLRQLMQEAGLSEDKLSFTELINSFYMEVAGTQPGEDELRLLREIAEKAGVTL